MGQIVIIVATVITLLSGGVVAGSSVAPGSSSLAPADAIMPSGGG